MEKSFAKSKSRRSANKKQRNTKYLKNERPPQNNIKINANTGSEEESDNNESYAPRQIVNNWNKYEPLPKSDVDSDDSEAEYLASIQQERERNKKWKEEKKKNLQKDRISQNKSKNSKLKSPTDVLPEPKPARGSSNFVEKLQEKISISDDVLVNQIQSKLKVCSLENKNSNPIDQPKLQKCTNDITLPDKYSGVQDIDSLNRKHIPDVLSDPIISKQGVNENRNQQDKSLNNTKVSQLRNKNVQISQFHLQNELPKRSLSNNISGLNFSRPNEIGKEETVNKKGPQMNIKSNKKTHDSETWLDHILDD